MELIYESRKGKVGFLMKIVKISAERWTKKILEIDYGLQEKKKVGKRWKWGENTTGKWNELNIKNV